MLQKLTELRTTSMNKILFIISSFLLMSCSRSPFLEDKVLGGKIVFKSQLNKGYNVYRANCLSCHGDKGDGTGITYRALVTKPRNLTQGIYKFGLSLDGGLPSDEDFANILNHGLRGTAMLPWGLDTDEVFAVTQYIKTLAPQVWEDKNFVEPLRPKFSRDPFKYTYESQAIEKGKKVYHQTAQCFTCHKAYLSVEEMRNITEDQTIDDKSEVFQIKPQISSYFLGKKQDDLLPNNPPDFKYHNVRSARNVEELYQRIYVGVNGTAMPPWNGTITDEEIWSVAYYVDSLIKEKKF